MKRILFEIFAAVLLVSACAVEDLENSPVAEGGVVSIDLSLNIPELASPSTRAFGDDEAANGMAYMAGCPLQLVVFDANGYLAEVYDVTPTSSDEDEVFFNVNLTQTTSKRIIHFIVNSPVKASDYTFGHESTIIGNLDVALTDTAPNAYWQRIEYNGISENTDMTRIPMLRNFSKITVSSTAEDFIYSGYAVVNVWDKGTVAPYMGEGAFASLNEGENMKTYSVITNTVGYEGVWPADAALSSSDPAQVTFGTTPFYMYERRNTYVSENIPATYLLIKGQYKGEESYYKLDLVYNLDEAGDNKQYYNILRNFHYNVTITSVSGAGYKTPAEAASKAASNNLMGSIDIRDLTNISDAIDRLYVSYTDTTIMDQTIVALKYKVVQSSSDDLTNASVKVTNITSEDNRIIDLYYINASGENVYIWQNGAAVNGYTVNTDIAVADEWSTLYVTFEDIPSDWQVVTNTLRLAVSGLSRETDFYLRKKLYMIVECDPVKVPFGISQKVAANILIPTAITGASDPYQLFPMDFLVEAEQMTLSPDVVTNAAVIEDSPTEMPVVLGSSIIPDKAGKQTFRYKRTIVNDEYQKLPIVDRTVQYDTDGDGVPKEITGKYRVIPCNFLTNTEVSATKVYAENKYFTLIQAGSFINYKASELVGEQYYGIRDVTLEVFVDTPGTYTVTFYEEGGYSSSPVEVTVPEGSNSANVTYKTQSWSGNVSAVITSSDGGSVTVTGDERNVLKVGAMTAGGNTPDTNTTITFHDASGNTLGTTTWTALSAGTYEVQTDSLKGLTDPLNSHVGYFSYSARSGRQPYTYKSDTLNASQITGGTTLNFNRQ